MSLQLFYSESEKRAFFIPDYYIDSNSNVVAFTAILLKESENLAKITGGEMATIKSQYIETSSRYKHMRVFYIDVAQAPQNAMILDGTWTMYKWITN